MVTAATREPLGPGCDVCKAGGVAYRPATHDTKAKTGPRYLCDGHYAKAGVKA